MIIINALARPQAHAVNLSRPNASHFLVELRSGSAKSCRSDYLDRFRKPDGKGRKVRRDVTAGRRQVDTFPPVCVEPATSRERVSGRVCPSRTVDNPVGEDRPLHAYVLTEDIHAPLAILRVTVILESIFGSVYHREGVHR